VALRFIAFGSLVWRYGVANFTGTFRAGPLSNVINIFQKLNASPEIFITDVPVFTPESREAIALALNS
jgi:hypothetical protein